jgi:lysozyme family protein
MVDFFPVALAFNWRPENDGQPYHDDPHDIGGATSWGVTFRTWQFFEHQHGRPGLLATFRTLQKEDFTNLYRTSFWNSIQCGLFGAVGIQIFDAGVASGPENAVKFLQHCAGANIDGELGPKTIAAALAMSPVTLAMKFCAEREAFYHTCCTAKYYERGWDGRAERCRDLTLSLLARADTFTPQESCLG